MGDPNYTKLHETLDKSPQNSNASEQQHHIDQSQVHSMATHSPLDSNDQPRAPHTAFNSGTASSQPHSPRENAHLTQHEDKSYNKIPRQPFEAPKDTGYNDIPRQSFQEPKNNSYNDIPNSKLSIDKVSNDIQRGQPFPPMLDSLPSISQVEKYIKPDLTTQETRTLRYEEYKIAFFGAPGVGKSSIIRRFIDDQFIEDYHPQRNVYEQRQVFLRRIQGGKYINLMVWEIGHAVDLDIINANVFEKCGVAIIVFDVSEHNTLRAAKQCWEKVKSRVGSYPTKFLLVGNKCDLPENDDVRLSKDKANIFATEKEILYYEISAKHQQINKIHKLFEKAVDKAKEAKDQNSTCVIL